MIEDTALIEKRAELKRQLTAGEYKTLADVILDGVGHFIQKLTRNPEPISFWYSGLVISLIILLIPYSISILLGEVFLFEVIQAQILGLILSFSILLGIKIGIPMLLTTFRDSILDALESDPDLDDLQRWLAVTFNPRTQLRASIIIVLAAILFGIVPTTLGILAKLGAVSFVGVGLLVIFWFPISIGLYNFFILFPLLARLRRYRFKLYAIDPSSSEVITRLSDALSKLLYMVATIAVILTISFTFFPATEALMVLFNSSVAVLLSWVPLVALFVNNQYSLAQIIGKAKWKTLNELQTQIENLHAQQSPPDEKTLSHINKLVDYHNQIKATRNSALDLRAGLNFLNSLLLPLLASVLTNIDHLLAFFS